VRYIGELLIRLGVLHIAVGLTPGRRQFGAMVREGVVDTIDGHPDREWAFWFTMFGPGLIAQGQLAWWSLRRTGTLPDCWEWNLLATCNTGALLIPRSGFWFGIPQVLLSRAATHARQVRYI